MISIWYYNNIDRAEAKPAEQELQQYYHASLRDELTTGISLRNLKSE
jgi:hypothetical protein